MPLTTPNLQRLQHYDRAMIRQICNIYPEDMATVSSRQLLAKLQLDDFDVILREMALMVWTYKAFICFDSLHPSQQVFSHVRTGLPGLNQYKVEYLAQGHNPVPLTRLKPAVPQFLVKHSTRTTELLRHVKHSSGTV